VTARSWLSNPLVDGAITIAPNANFADSSIPAVKAFQHAMKKYYPDDLTKPQYGTSTLTPWMSGKPFEAAAKGANLGPTSTGADVKKGLYAAAGAFIVPDRP
jgi:branched-chain amino acid transport system substrate-binding protein